MKRKQTKEYLKYYKQVASASGEAPFYRYRDTEAKILEDIASQIDESTTGAIDLYTELDPCQSCSSIILEFRKKFPDITLNIFSKNME